MDTLPDYRTATINPRVTLLVKLGEFRPRNWRRTVAEEGFGYSAAKPDDSFHPLDFVRHVPGHCLPIRVKDEIAAITV